MRQLISQSTYHIKFINSELEGVHFYIPDQLWHRLSNISQSCIISLSVHLQSMDNYQTL